MKDHFSVAGIFLEARFLIIFDASRAVFSVSPGF